MSQPASDVLAIVLSKLEKHRNLIQQVYLAGSFRKDGSKDDRSADELLQHRIFVYGGKDMYRLSGSLTGFLDEITQRSRAYDLLSDKAAAQVERISNLITGYQDAVISGKAGDADAMIDEFHTACVELSGTFSSGISRLMHQAETNFAVVSSAKAKNNQNEHYLKQAKLFRNALSALESIYTLEENNLLCCDDDALNDTYRTLIGDHKIEWNTGILRLIHLFESYLYRERVLPPDVKRFRQFADFLERNPGYELIDLEDTHHRPQWMMRDSGLSLVAYADPGECQAFDYLTSIVASLPEREDITPRRIIKEVGRIEWDTDNTVVVYRPPAYQIALRRFAKAAAKSALPLSALEWKHEYCLELGVPDDIWLHLVLDMKDNHALGLPSLIYTQVEYNKAPISRNILVADVIVHGRQAN